MADEDVGLLDAGAETDTASDVSEDVAEVPGSDQADADRGTEVDGGQDQADKPGDGRTVPVKWREAIAKVKESDPALAKELSRSYWKTQQYEKLGAPAELQSLKEAVELHGGIEGIQGIVEEVEAARALDGGLEKGDPQVVEGYVRDFPEGFKKIVPVALSALAKNFPESYEKIGATILHNTFAGRQIYDAAARLGAALKAGDAKAAVADYDKIVDLLLYVQGQASKSQEDPYADRAKQLEEKEQAIAKQERTGFVDRVRNVVDPMIVRDVNKQIATALKGRAMEPAARDRFLNEIRGKLADKVHSDQNYARQWPGVRDARDHDRAVKFNYAAYAKALPAIVTSVMKDPVWSRYFSGGGAALVRRAASSGNGNQPIVGVPSIADVDFNRTDKSTFLATKSSHGTAWLKTGKQAKW
jgi:hypothetical protein